jgi:hypothetical protein
MKSMNTYLIVWGSALHSIRIGVGENEAVAAKYAFGTYDSRRMTFKQITPYVAKVDTRRTRSCYELLLSHAEKMKMTGEMKLYEEANQQAAIVKRQWEKAWGRLKLLKPGETEGD